ncbi:MULTISPECIES: ribbon-helix-helix domain-containing protein [Arthrospira]|uniref:ribbon-helix-helix domain-containing protein n=1 Tax=Oscillatoriales TaxID=1150 RepID=UPI0002921D0D|nr:type II toxin-antitoxin system ParD family antitoxin [Arthrospira platensis]MDT9183169.1 type II toxin-antitoxin system ParD family antitoxin [Limnospira sp. PMC 289.06]MDT9310870.1 type II toxin-antitoxin system ParD family antitoxin [Limnospira sp. Paracas R14]WAK73981.1 type II toxin-antitoxin system ParD family antitoxin [Arthrospira sp. PCC 9108]
MQKLSFLESLVESGKYPSAEDAIATGIRLLADRERIYQGRFEECNGTLWLVFLTEMHPL